MIFLKDPDPLTSPLHMYMCLNEMVIEPLVEMRIQCISWMSEIWNLVLILCDCEGRKRMQEQSGNYSKFV
jgi:hypothetical protein